MRKLLNKFAVWLYKRTKVEEKMSPEQFFGGLEVLVSDFVPNNKVMMGSGKYKSMMETLVDQEINNPT